MMLRIPSVLRQAPVRGVARCFASSSDSRWPPQSRNRPRDGKPSRWGPPRSSGGGRHRDGQRSDRRPSATRTNNGEDVPQLAGEGVYGIHSVLQALESGHRRTHALYVREEKPLTDGQRPKKKSAADVKAMERIKELADTHKLDVKSTSKWMLNHITGDKPHQGVVLDAAPIQLQEFVPAEPSVFTESDRSPVILVLDEIHDPQNFGAILRSAHFLGCAAVVVSDRNSAPLSPAVSRASVGALEVLVANNKLLKARNLHEVLAVSGDLGWRVVGASSGPNSITSTNLSADARPTILVMGNEHRGLRKNIRQCCEDIVIIPGQSTDEDTRVDSLNVSVASAILLYELLHH
ncbi:Ribose methyltransferase [Phytophthora boehmeriae]|uniref:rRNA methyltransferase 1, mitochondrial n=1 Tax=Phytophthora boehmeriae TaxID=109152 RepID=A0A8T1WWY4_9STRA|nr:Ribose methyltransferase [Phytophthora boehmeriae]